MKNLTAISLAVFSIAFAGYAAAHSPATNGDCHNIGDATLLVAAEVPLTATVGDVTVYVGEDTHVYTESNGQPGLQTHSHTCTLKHDANGNSIPKAQWTVITVPADTLVL